jgi:hypothetical protein
MFRLFSTTSIMVPEPLAFPRAQWADAIAFHAGLLERHLGQIFAEAREAGGPGDPFCFLSDEAAIVAARSTGLVVDLVPRPDAALMTHKRHGICRELYLDRGPFAFPAVVSARGVVSLHTLEVEDPRGTPRIAVVSRDDVVEPRKQEHREQGGWIVTRWVGHDREARYAWRPAPKEPASREETIERVMALRGAMLRREIAAYLRDGHAPEDTFARVQSSILGDKILVSMRGAHRAFTCLFYPEIDAAIEEATDPHHVPVILDAREWSALLWILPDDAEGSPAPPPRIIESRGTGPILDDSPSSQEEEEEEEHAFEEEERTRGAAPPPVAPEPPRPAKRRHETDVIEQLDQWVLDEEVDRIIELPQEVLERRIAALGFVPEMERGYGPGLRERVVRALSEVKDDG